MRLFDSGGRGPLDAVVADFNGDGKNDVAVTIPFLGVSIMLGDGQGHLVQSKGRRGELERLCCVMEHPSYSTRPDMF